MEVRNGVREFGSWSEQKSSSGKRYYYNKDTEVSQWDKPDEWKEWERVQEAAANTRVPPPPLPPMPPPPPHHNTSVPPPPITMPSMHFMQQPPPNYAHSAHQAAAFVPSQQQQTQSFNAAQVAAAAAAFHNAMPIGFHHHQPPPNITQPPPTQHTQHTPVQHHPFMQMSTSVPPPPSPMFAGKPTTTTMSATFSHHNTPTRSSSQTTPRHMYGQHGGNSAHHTPSSHYDRTAATTRQDSSEVKMDIDNDSNSDRATPKAAAPMRVAKRDSQNEERPAKMARPAEPSPPVHRRSSVSPALSNGPPAPAKTESPVQPQQHDWMRFYSKELAEKAKPPGDDIQQKLVDYGLNDVKLHLELGKQLVDLKGIRALVQTAQMRVILNDRKLVHLAEAQRTLETKMREHSAGALNIPFSTSNTA